MHLRDMSYESCEAAKNQLGNRNGDTRAKTYPKASLNSIVPLGGGLNTARCPYLHLPCLKHVMMDKVVVHAEEQGSIADQAGVGSKEVVVSASDKEPKRVARAHAHCHVVH